MESVASTSSERSQRRRLTPVATGALGKAAELGAQAALVTVVPRVIGPSAYGTLALAHALVRRLALVASLPGSEQQARAVVHPPSMRYPHVSALSSAR